MCAHLLHKIHVVSYTAVITVIVAENKYPIFSQHFCQVVVTTHVFTNTMRYVQQNSTEREKRISHLTTSDHEQSDKS